MTLTDKENKNQSIFYESDSYNNNTHKTMPEKLKMPNTNSNEIGQSLKEVIQQAHQQGRLTCGLNEAGQVLEICPEEVMLCVLPELEKCDITLHIHFTLIEAFCWENGIKLIKVDRAEKVKKIVSEMTGDSDKTEGRLLEQRDYNCVLIEYPVDECSESDEDVIEYYKLTSDLSPPPIIQLPV